MSGVAFVDTVAVSLIKVAEKRIAAAKADMGTMQLPEVPEKLTQETDD